MQSKGELDALSWFVQADRLSEQTDFHSAHAHTHHYNTAQRHGQKVILLISKNAQGILQFI